MTEGRRPEGGADDARPAPTLLEELAAWASTVSLDDLPSAALAKSRQGILDTLGVALAGGEHDAATRFTGVVEDLAGRSDCTMLGPGGRTSRQLAAMHHAYLAHILDFDDTHFDAIVHVNAPVVAAILAVGEAQAVPGTEAMVAHVVGLELTSRVAIAAGRQPNHGWHLTGTAGAFGAAAATSRILGLDTETTAQALAISSTLSSGLRGHRGTMTKALNPANAAGNGVLAALAAQRGMTASTRILDDHAVSYLASHGAPHDPELADGLGHALRMLDWDPKPYPCGVVIHPAVDAALDVRAVAPSPLDGRWVEKVELEVNPFALSLTGNPDPRDGLQSKFSVYHAVAAALVDGALLPHHFDEDQVLDPRLVTVRDRVTATAREDLPRDEATVTVRLVDGSTLHQRSKARGTRERRMTDDDVTLKFLALATPVLGTGPAEAVIAAVSRLADEPDLGRLLRIATEGDIS